jgi:quinolinate synthase
MLRIQTPLPESYLGASPDELVDRIAAARTSLGPRLVILGHHYQRDEVIAWADATGDSLKLSRYAANRSESDYVVFCGVHFMAEAADVLTSNRQQVILPDLNAGCSMADMADAEDAEDALGLICDWLGDEAVIPMVYINSSARLKALVAANGGSVCTSSNARAVMQWAFERSGAAQRVMFLPDQHLGRNTGHQLGLSDDEMAVVDPRKENFGLSRRQVERARLLLWKGHCSVHQRFRPGQVEQFRAQHPNGLVLAHPECSAEVVALADHAGSTERIIEWVAGAPSGTPIAIGTEINLVGRLAAQNPDKVVVSLDPVVCPCSTMYRIDQPHLAWVLEGLVDGVVHNRITVEPEVAKGARLALERMLGIC